MFAYVDPINKDSVGISFSQMTESCQMYADQGEARFQIREDGTYGGLLGYSLDTGESFIFIIPKFILLPMSSKRPCTRITVFICSCYVQW